MKYWRGYLTAAIFGLFTYALQEFAKTHTQLIDMVYPYVTRILQDMLANWSGSVEFCLWQLLAGLLVLGIVASIVLMIVLKWNPIQWFGWVLATVSVIFFLHTGLYGLNYYAGSVAEDIRLEQIDFTVTELADATRYYRDKANELAEQVARDSEGNVSFDEFEVLAQNAGKGYDNLVYQRSFPIFSGERQPVKKLGWADMYTSMGITGYTMSLTGEAAVNPQIPAVSMPFMMSHEMAHRMCIALEKDANFSAFLACQAHDDVQFRYSGYFMAYRYCYNALVSVDTAASDSAAAEISSGVSAKMKQDIDAYNAFYAKNQKKGATNTANKINDTYIKMNGDEEGIVSYNNVTALLVSWYHQEQILPALIEEETTFDPFDKTQVDLSGIREPVVTEPAVEATEAAEGGE